MSVREISIYQNAVSIKSSAKAQKKKKYCVAECHRGQKVAFKQLHFGDSETLSQKHRDFACNQTLPLLAWMMQLNLLLWRPIMVLQDAVETFEELNSFGSISAPEVGWGVRSGLGEIKQRLKPAVLFNVQKKPWPQITPDIAIVVKTAHAVRCYRSTTKCSRCLLCKSSTGKRG